MAGRRLANRFRSLRMPSRPRSGRCSRGRLSHCGPPTAPSRMASASRASLRVASGYGSPVASTAQPPSRASSISNLRSSAFRTRTASAVISGPMPSPGKTQIFMVYSSCFSGEQPGLLGTALVFEGLDLVCVTQGQADIVPAVEQAFLAEGVDLESHRMAIRADHLLRRQINHQLVTRRCRDLLHDGLDFGGGQHDRQNAVLEAVVEENVGEGFGDDGLEPVVQQRPGRVLAGAAAAEVGTRDEDFGALITILVQDEIGVLRTLGTI